MPRGASLGDERRYGPRWLSMGARGPTCTAAWTVWPLSLGLGSGLLALAPAGSRDAVALQPDDQRAPGEAQLLRGAGLIARVPREGLDDPLALVGAGGRTHRVRRRRALRQSRGG